MEVDVKNSSGESLRKIQLDDAVFDVPMNEQVLHTVVKAYRANARQGTHATKTRSFVSGGGKKPYRQKGTGSARQGSRRAPHFSGGGVAHGPHPRSHRQATNRKVRQLALRVALSDRARHGKLVVVDDFNIDGYKTKSVVAMMNNLGLSSALLADERRDDYLYYSTRNIHGASVITPQELNAMDVLRHAAVVVTENAVGAIQQRFRGEDA